MLCLLYVWRQRVEGNGHCSGKPMDFSPHGSTNNPPPPLSSNPWKTHLNGAEIGKRTKYTSVANRRFYLNVS